MFSNVALGKWASNTRKNEDEKRSSLSPSDQKPSLVYVAVLFVHPLCLFNIQILARSHIRPATWEGLDYWKLLSIQSAL